MKIDESRSKKRKVIIGCVIIFILLLTAVVFSPSLRNGFTNWDDQEYVTRNADLSNFSLRGVTRLCFSFYNANWHPLTMLSYLLDYRFFKLDPQGYHAVNLALHLLNCVLVFWFIFKLSGSIITASVTAVLFAIHPMHVESVAWISERKDLLYSGFFLASLIAYVCYLEKPKPRYYYLSLFMFVLSLLSKVMAIMLVFVLFLIDYLRQKKIDKKSLIEKVPFFQLACIFMVAGLFAQRTYGTLIQNFLLTVIHKVLIVSYALIFYLCKILFPVNLSCHYPYPKIDQILTLPFLVSPFIVAVLAALVLYSKRYTKKIIFGTLFFLLTILPVIQIVPCGNWITADRFTYLTSVGLFYLAAEGARWLYLRIKSSAKIKLFVLFGILAGIIAVLSVLSWQRCGVWKNSLTLWSDALKKYPNSSAAYNNRATAYIAQKEYDLAIEDCSMTLQIEPNHALAYYNRALAYSGKGEFDKASADFKKYLTKSGLIK